MEDKENKGTSQDGKETFGARVNLNESKNRLPDFEYTPPPPPPPPPPPTDQKKDSN